jgi:hypothetical protein
MNTIKKYLSMFKFGFLGYLSMMAIQASIVGSEVWFWAQMVGFLSLALGFAILFPFIKNK